MLPVRWSLHDLNFTNEILADIRQHLAVLRLVVVGHFYSWLALEVSSMHEHHDYWRGQIEQGIGD